MNKRKPLACITSTVANVPSEPAAKKAKTDHFSLKRSQGSRDAAPNQTHAAPKEQLRLGKASAPTTAMDTRRMTQNWIRTLIPKDLTQPVMEFLNFRDVATAVQVELPSSLPSATAGTRNTYTHHIDIDLHGMEKCARRYERAVSPLFARVTSLPDRRSF